MIKNFRCRETQKIWHGQVSLRLPRNIQQVARRKLRILNNAKKLGDLLIPSSNRLEPLKGDRQEQHSIRINKQWRICFQWIERDAYNVAIEDYH